MLSGSVILTLTLAVHLSVEPDQAAVQQQLCDVLRNDLASRQQPNEQDVSVQNARVSNGKTPALPRNAITTNGCKD